MKPRDSSWLFRVARSCRNRTSEKQKLENHAIYRNESFPDQKFSFSLGIFFVAQTQKRQASFDACRFLLFYILLSSRFSFVYPQSAHFIIRCSLFSLRSTSPLLQRKVSLVKASRRDSASLVKGGGLPQASRRDFASLAKGGGLPSRQAGGILPPL